MTFYKRNGWITEYGEMRNKKPMSREEFEEMAKETMKKEKEVYGHKFCYTIKKVRKHKDFT